MAPEPPTTLAQRLRALREGRWPRRPITQAQLAMALGDGERLSVPLISSWESVSNPKVPPPRRLEAYARFFATERSLEGDAPHLVAAVDLTDAEREQRDRLLTELTALREAAHPRAGAQRVTAGWPHDRLLRFPEGQAITIVCGLMPYGVRPERPYTDPEHPDYEEFFNFADPRALMELFGYLRAVNPYSDVIYKTSQESAVTTDDYSNHLMLIGGVDWNLVTRDLLRQIDIPVRQLNRDEDSDLGGFEVTDEHGEPVLHQSRVSRDGRLLDDVVHFYRGPNPYNRERTVTLFNGNFTRGTLGSVRALTDPKFRDRNEEFVAEKFAGCAEFSLLTRAAIANNQIATPDWTIVHRRLHEWRGAQVGGGEGSPT